MLASQAYIVKHGCSFFNKINRLRSNVSPHPFYGKDEEEGNKEKDLTKIITTNATIKSLLPRLEKIQASSTIIMQM